MITTRSEDRGSHTRYGEEQLNYLVPVPGSCRESECIVIVFPHAGGSPRQYVHWPQMYRRLAVGKEPEPKVLGVTYPLRDHASYSNPARDLQALSTDIAREVLFTVECLGAVARPERICRVVLAGHSLGAIVAFEVLRELARLLPGRRLPTLLISGQVTPEHAGGGTFHRSSDMELINELGRMDPRTAVVLSDPEMASLHLPAIREDYRLIETYRCQPVGDDRSRDREANEKLNTKIVIVKGDSDSELMDAHINGWARWVREVDGPFTVPGDHMHHITRNELAYLAKLYACRESPVTTVKGMK